jgi:predicted ATPase/DNA-binding XRE family transcriptional regulator
LSRKIPFTRSWSPHPPAFGSLLKRYRIAAELTQEELAERARLSARAVSDLERGARRNPYRDTVQQLADALDLGDDDRATFSAAARRTAAGVQTPVEWAATSVTPTNLPAEPTSFIGRRQEIAAVSDLIEQPAVRLVTLTGPGGIGKTRMATQVAALMLSSARAGETLRYPDGVFFVSLSSVADPDLVSSAIAGVVKVTDRGGQDLTHALVEHFRSRRVLLVLDNFEHLMDARHLLTELLELCPFLGLLVTSTSVLNLSWEHAFEVPPLDLPEPADGTEQGESEAMALLAERARAVNSGFVLTAENAEAVAEICRRLDGMPLAIELAASRLRLLPPQALLARLTQRLDLLTGGAHDLPTRHQTLRGAIDWSYTLLTDEEKRLFARLSAFRGGCTLEAVDAVCNSERDLQEGVLEGVASLVEKSLLRQEGRDEPRFVMLETIREYASERLEEVGGSEELKEAHAVFYATLAEEASHASPASEQSMWLGRLEGERGNFRAALSWCLDTGEVERGMSLAIALQGFWMLRGPLGEGRWWLETLSAGEGGSAALRAASLMGASGLAAAEGRWRRAAELIKESLDLFRERGDRSGYSRAVGALAVTLFMAGDTERAMDLVLRSEEAARETGDQMLLAVALRFHAGVEAERGETQRTQELGEESLMIYRQLGDEEGMTEALRILAGAAYGAGDSREAHALTDELLTLIHRSRFDPDKEEWLESLAYRARMLGDYAYASHILETLVVRAETVGDRRIAAHARTGLGLLAREQGPYDRGAEFFTKSIAELSEVGDLFARCRALIGLSDVERDRGRAERVIELCEEAIAVLEEIDDAFFMGYAMHNLGVAAWLQGDLVEAQHLLDEALRLVRNRGSVADTVEVLTSAGILALDGNHYDRASGTFTECLTSARRSQSRWVAPTLLEGMACVASGNGQAERAALLFGTAEAARQQMGTPKPLALAALFDRFMRDVRTKLGQERFDSALGQGRLLSLEEACDLALGQMSVSH